MTGPHGPARGRPPQRTPRAGGSRARPLPAVRRRRRRAGRPTATRSGNHRAVRPVRPAAAARAGSGSAVSTVGCATASPPCACCCWSSAAGSSMLQGVDGQKYAAAAASQRIVDIPVHALRGQIVDRNGTVLAYTSEAQDITADPKQVKTAANDVAVASTSTWSTWSPATRASCRR